MDAMSAVSYSFIERAIEGVRRNIPVIPVEPGSKATHIGTKAATLDSAAITQWNTANPNYNCGLVAQAKQGGVWILDCDSPEVVKEFEKATGKKFPTTFAVQSNKGGHRYFRQNEASLKRLKNFSVTRAGKEFFSVRWDNQYCVGPLSIHEETGRIYEIVSDVDPIEAPDFVIDWLLAQADEPTKSVKEVAKGTGDIPDGMRDTVLTSIGGTLRDAGLNEDAIYEHLYKINEERCKPPKSDADIQRIAHSVARYEDGIERRIKETPLLGGVPAGSTAAASSPAAEVDPKDWRSHFASLDQLQDGDVRMLIKGFMPEGITFFGSLAGKGKTFVGVSLSRAFSTGRPLFGQFEVLERIPVLYLIPESSGRAFKARLNKFGIPNDEKKFLCRTLSEGPTLALDSPMILEAVKQMKPIVILDTAIRFSTAQDENAAMQNQKLVNDIFALRQAGAQAVIGFHHSSKSSAKESMSLENTLRGTGDLGAMCDCVYGLRRDEMLFENGSGPLELEVECVKPRDFDPPLPFRLAAKYKAPDGSIHSFIDEIGDFSVVDKQAEQLNINSRLSAIIASDPEISIRSLAQALQVNTSKVYRALQDIGWHKPRGKKIWEIQSKSSTGSVATQIQEEEEPVEL